MSVGEVNAAKTIIKQLENKFDDSEILISTTTDTGFARATTLFSEAAHLTCYSIGEGKFGTATLSNIEVDLGALRSASGMMFLLDISRYNDR